MARGTVDAQAVHAQLAHLGTRAAGTTETRFFLRVHKPALLLLGFFTTHLLVGVTHTLALIGFGTTEGANFCSDLTELLLVRALQHDLGVLWRFRRDTFRQRILDRMREAQ